MKHKQEIVENYKTVLNGIQLVVADIGARGGSKSIWDSSLNTIVKYIFFEPESKEYKKLTKNYGDGAIVIPAAVWCESGLKDLYITKNKSQSSLLKPNTKVIKDSLNFNKGFYDIEKVEKIECDTLESLILKNNCKFPDFIKIDIQGGEKFVFNSFSSSTWERIIGVDTEAYSSNLYKNCGNISDLLNIFYKNNFEIYNVLPTTNFLYTSHNKEKLYDINNLESRPNSSSYYGRQMIFDLLLFKKINHLLLLKSEEVVRKTIFLHLLYKYYDHAIYLLYESQSLGIISSNSFLSIKKAIKNDITFKVGRIKRLREKFKVKKYTIQKR